MSSLDPRTPIIVGAGQITQRPGEGDLNSLDLMVEAVKIAAASAGSGGDSLLQKADALSVIDVFSWPVPNPAALAAEALGINPRETLKTVIGGNGPIAMLSHLAVRIANGELDVAILTGGEAGRAFFKGQTADWPTQDPEATPNTVIGVDTQPSHEAELAVGLMLPIHYYPMYEQGLRHASGRGVQEHQEWLAKWWAGYTDVASNHPQAWLQEKRTPEQILSPEGGNRMISDPYPRSMNALIQVDQGAALIVTSVEAAEAAGISKDRWTFIQATSGCYDHWFHGERDQLHRSPAINENGKAIFGYTGGQASDCDYIDLYSCFPCAVQVGANELGLKVDEPGRPLTVTGGLPIFGGPANNYVTHALVTLVDKLRENPEATALSSAVGWYLTKHGLALLSGKPGDKPYAHFSPQDKVDAQPKRRIESSPASSGIAWKVETYTSAYDHAGIADVSLISAIGSDGSRAFAKSADADTIAAISVGDKIGTTVAINGDNEFSF